MHNLLPVHGAKVRDALRWAGYLQLALDQLGDSEVYFGQHNWPIWGNARIADFITKLNEIRAAHPAIRQLRNELGRERTLSVHVTLVPYLAAAGELKTKPTQHSVRELTSLGIQPDVLLCRCEHPLPENERAKIAAFCNVRKEAVIPALDAKSIYAVPLQYHAEGLDNEVLRAFGLESDGEPDLTRWDDIIDRQQNPEGEVTIGVVGKYVGLGIRYYHGCLFNYGALWWSNCR